MNESHEADLLRLKGELLLDAGDLPGGIALLEESGRLREEPATWESLAFGSVRLGNSDEAAAALRAFLDAPVDPVGWEPQIRWQEAHVRLAEIHVERGEGALAASLLDLILEHWSDADADFGWAIKARELRERI